MKLGVLFSGGKDSMYSTWLAKKEGYKICCLISIVSENPGSFMFHTPSIFRVKEQAKVMGIPLVIVKTKGEKEKELKDLEKAINIAVKKYKVWKLKKLYGREYYGINRSTFLIDPKGNIAASWSHVKVKGHVDEVKKKLKELS